MPFRREQRRNLSFMIHILKPGEEDLRKREPTGDAGGKKGFESHWGNEGGEGGGRGGEWWGGKRREEHKKMRSGEEKKRGKEEMGRWEEKAKEEAGKTRGDEDAVSQVITTQERKTGRGRKATHSSFKVSPTKHVYIFNMKAPVKLPGVVSLT